MGNNLGGRDRYSFTGSLNGAEMVTAPDSPPDGQFVIWLQAGDNTAGYGTDGDLLVKTTVDGTSFVGVLATLQRLDKIE